MKEKLTKERFAEMCEAIGRRVATEGLYFGPLGAGLWKAIEADREAIRAETREELLRDHVQIPPFEDWPKSAKSIQLAFKLIHGNGQESIAWAGDTPEIRRPLKKRARTREEKVNELKAHLARQHAWLPDALKEESTIDDLCRAFEIPTEVDE